MNAPVNPAHVQWDDFSELHVKDDGGGLLSGIKALRQGTLAELVYFVASLPAEDRDQYVIEKSGDHRLTIGEILMLSRRADFPHP